MSVSWGDHLDFGRGIGRLRKPEHLRERIRAWKNDLNAAIILWRENNTFKSGHFFAARGHKHPASSNELPWDDLKTVPNLCHEEGFKAYLYVTLFDEGWPLPHKNLRMKSYHSKHSQHLSRQTRFSRKHHEYTVINKEGNGKQWGVLSLAYPEVRAHFRERYLNLLSGHDFDGLFICLRSQSKPAVFADQFGFNEPIRKDHLKRHGTDILKEKFKLQGWRDLQGEYLTKFLYELRVSLKKLRIKLGVGIPTGDIIGPPLGSWTLHWRDWVKKGLVDDLIINQDSTTCPSLWHKLWPMHSACGYPDRNVGELTTYIDRSYAPVISKHDTDLFIARQWDDPDPAEEKNLLDRSAVKGLVFSSFRYDNPNAKQ